ncbi:MAG TPA: D-alanyl-D-alanine carboxypeptidase, partial [Polyangia bacterium]|nr:D-alanyl-D-alanine carboxypeptidase [Polyangia bacterium]
MPRIPFLRLTLGIGLAVTGSRAQAKPAEPAATVAPTAPAAEPETPPAHPGARPLMGLAPRPGGEPAKGPRDPAERHAWLQSEIDGVFKAPALAKAKISAVVLEADSGKTLYARDDKTPLNAASNVKIVTTSAALSLLGPEYRWRTTVAAVGPASGPPLPAGGEVSGDLYFRGSGDPTFSTEDLTTIVGELVGLGLHKVRGSLVVD